MKKLLLFVAYLTSCSSCVAQPNKELPCWITDDYSKMVTTQEAILNSYLYPIDLDNPVVDAQKKIKNGDYRLIGIGGFGINYPGIDMRKEGFILCKLGSRYLKGTSDAKEGDSHMKLIQRFNKYAEIYNTQILEFYQSQDFKAIVDESV